MKKLLLLLIAINSTLMAQVSITPVNPICRNASPITLTASQTGGYWSGNGITNPITGTFDPSITFGTPLIKYRVGNDSATMSIIIKHAPLISMPQQTISICNGQNYTLHPNYYFDYNSTNLSFLWTGAGSGTDSTLVVNKGGDYIVTATEEGCSTTDSVTVVVVDTVHLNTQFANICNGQNITLRSGNGIVNWGNNVVDSNLTVNTAGEYLFTTQNNGCNVLGKFVVSSNNGFNYDLQDSTTCGTGGIQTNIQGGNNSSFVWQTPNGFEYTKNIYMHSSGKYNLTITSPGGCITKDSATITLNYNPLNFGSQMHDTLVCSQTPFIYTAQNGFLSYEWYSNNNLIGINQSISLSTPGVYVARIAISNTCTLSDSVNFINNQSLPLNISDSIICTGDSIYLSTGYDATIYSILWNNSASSSSIRVGAGNYSVTVSNNAGCSATDSAVITEVSAPKLNLPDVQSCYYYAVLDAGNVQSAIWSKNSNIISYNKITTVYSSGSYYVEAAYPSGCKASDSVNVTLGNTNSAHINKGDTSICKNQPITIGSLYNHSTYQWKNLTTNQIISTAPSISVSDSGVFQLIVTDGSCTSTDTVNIYSFTCTGTENINASSYSFQVYPNPSNGSSNIILSGLESTQNITISVHDAVGKEVLLPFITNGMNGNNIPISCESLSNGLYFIKISYNNQSNSIPLVIQN